MNAKVPDTQGNPKPATSESNPSQPAGQISIINWPDGSITVVSEHTSDKKSMVFTNLYITNTSFPAFWPEEEILNKISELNQIDLHGVYLYDQANNKVIYRTVNHFKPSFISGEESKYIIHLKNTEFHSEAQSRFYNYIF